MIVHHDDSSGRLGDRRAEHLAGMHQRTVEEASGNEDIAEHTALAVESQQMELFHRQVAQPGSQHADDVLGLPNPECCRTGLRHEAAGYFEGGKETSRFGGTDARGLLQLSRRPCCQAAQGSAAHLEQPAGYLERTNSRPSGSEEDGKELGRGQRAGAQRPEALAGEFG
jgi:hypothetical protein